MTGTDDAGRDGLSGHKLVVERVHVDVPRVLPQDTVTTHSVSPPPDPEGGRDTDMEFMTRNGGW